MKICIYCNKEIPEAEYASHKVLCKEQYVAEANRLSEGKEKPAICPRCGGQFVTGFALDEHLRWECGKENKPQPAYGEDRPTLHTWDMGDGENFFGLEA